MVAKKLFLAVLAIPVAALVASGCTTVTQSVPVPAASVPKAMAAGGGAGGTAPATPPPMGTIPSYTPETPNLTNDLGCRPALAPTTPDSAWSAAKVPTINSACTPLSPWTRFFLENASFSANDSYTNQAGLQNTLIANPGTTAQIQSSNIWNVGVGYSSKPILKQIRALFYPADEAYATSKQGTFWEDAFWEAVAVNASLSYGQALAKTNGMLTDALTTRPFYSLSASYSLSLERMWIYATQTGNPNAHPVDPGYYINSEFQDPKESPVFPWNQPISNGDRK